MANLAMTAGRLDSGGVWDLEDVEALEAARTLIKQYSEIDAEVAEVLATNGQPVEYGEVLFRLRPLQPA